MLNCIDCRKVMEHVETVGGEAWSEARYKCPKCRMRATVETSFSYDFDDEKQAPSQETKPATGDNNEASG